MITEFLGLKYKGVMMVKLEARATEKDIIISKDSFEHLLNCLDNQKYVGEVNADALEMSVEEIHGVQKDVIGLDISHG